MASQFQFAISEVGRRPREHGMLFCRPGALFADALAEGLRRRAVAPCDTDLVVLADPLGVGMAEEGIRGSRRIRSPGRRSRSTSATDRPT